MEWNEDNKKMRHVNSFAFISCHKLTAFHLFSTFLLVELLAALYLIYPGTISEVTFLIVFFCAQKYNKVSKQLFMTAAREKEK